MVPYGYTREGSQKEVWDQLLSLIEGEEESVTAGCLRTLLVEERNVEALGSAFLPVFLTTSECCRLH